MRRLLRLLAAHVLGCWLLQLILIAWILIAGQSVNPALLARGADPYLADASGNTPADIRPDGAATRLLGQQVLAASAADDTRWRLTAPGVEVRLRRERTVWPSDEAPALRLDLWNHWTSHYAVAPDPSAATLMIDGRRYTWAGVAPNAEGLLLLIRSMKRNHERLGSLLAKPGRLPGRDLGNEAGVGNEMP
jgi:hypothetical protein